MQTKCGDYRFRFSQMVTLRDEKSLIKGLILVVVGDAGPEVIANLSSIDDDDALITSLHLVSLAGLEDEIGDDDSRMLGPLPVKGTKDFKSLYYSTVMKASNAEDIRLREHGSKVGVILLFNSQRLPEIRRAAGLIEPYLELYFQKASETSDLTLDFAMKMYDHVVELISRPRLRTFWTDGEKMYEYKDPGFVRSEDDVMLLDEESKKIFVMNNKKTTPFKINRIRNLVNVKNFELYQNAFTIVTLESFGEIESLLIKHNIKVT